MARRHGAFFASAGCMHASTSPLTNNSELVLWRGNHGCCSPLFPHKLWLAVRKVLNDHQSDTSESTQDAASEPAADTLSRTAPWFRYIPLVVKTSAAAPVVAWAWRTYTLGAGFIDIVLIAVCYLGIVMALCTVSLSRPAFFPRTLIYWR